MMIFLFPQSRAVLIAVEALTFLFMMTRAYDGASALQVLLVLLLGSVLAVLISALYAGVLHQRLLLVLYSLLRPEDFIRVYEPLLKTKWIPSNVRFTLTAYLSNGYAAKGDFARARALLDAAPATAKRQKLSCDLILCGNRTSIALAEGCAEEAARQLAQMAQLIKDDRIDAKTRASYDAILRSQRAQLRVLANDCTTEDCDLLREESKKPGSALRKAELNCFIGRAYAQLGQTAFAREYLTAAAQSKEVCYGRLAQSALKTLATKAPAKGK